MQHHHVIYFGLEVTSGISSSSLFIAVIKVWGRWTKPQNDDHVDWYKQILKYSVAVLQKDYLRMVILANHGSMHMTGFLTELDYMGV